MKECHRCKENKEMSDFYKSNVMKDKLQAICKECTLIKNKEYKLKNPNYFADYKQENKQKIVKSDAEYRRKNKERITSYNIKWGKENPERVRAIYARRRSKKLGAGGDYSASDITFLIKTQKGKCIVCNKKLNNSYHVDHIYPIARGGRNDIYNIQLLCPTCNQVKSAKDPIKFMQSKGFLF